MGRGKTGRSRITKFAADFFAAKIRAWHGEELLWKAFWAYGVATSTVIATLYAVTVYDGRMALRQALLLCFAAYTAWILVSLWRYANNTKRPFRKRLSGWHRRDSRGLLRPTPETPCGPQPLECSISERRTDTKPT